MLQLEQLALHFKDWSADKGSESFFIARCDDLEKCEDPNEKIVLTNIIKNDQSTDWSKDDWERHQKQGNDILNEITNCLRQELEPKSAQIQAAIKKHCEYAKRKKWNERGN